MCDVFRGASRKMSSKCGRSAVLRAVAIGSVIVAALASSGCKTAGKAKVAGPFVPARYVKMYGEPQRTYQVLRAEGQIRVDGRIEEADWERANIMTGFTLADTGQKPTQTTEVRLLWDDQYLYVSFLCYDKFIYNTYTKPDDPVFANQDCVEVFLDPDKDPRVYAELDMSPANVVWTGLSWRPSYPDRPHYVMTAWNPRGLRTGADVLGDLNAVKQDSTLWSAEYAIPFDCLPTGDRRRAGHPRAGDTWRANFYRIDKLRPGKGREGVEFSAWSPPGLLNFHVPHRFGEIMFAE